MRYTHTNLKTYWCAYTFSQALHIDLWFSYTKPLILGINYEPLEHHQWPWLKKNMTLCILHRIIKIPSGGYKTVLQAKLQQWGDSYKVMQFEDWHKFIHASKSRLKY